MARFSWPKVIAASVLAGLAGCSGFEHRERPAWRTRAEESCLAQGLVREAAWIEASREIDGPGICGLHHPFKVRGLADGTVTLNAAATLDCSMIPALNEWIKAVVQPAALARFGEPVVELKTMGAYNCRGINNMSGAGLSEHAFGNAIDVAAFVLRSGRELSIMRGWKSPDDQERAFLHEAHGGACGMFTTVLGPGSNVFHYNHYHLDLAMHGSASRGLRHICKPLPDQILPEAPRHDNLPDPPAIEEELDMAQAPRPQPAIDGPGLRSFVATAAPPASVSAGAPDTRPPGGMVRAPLDIDAAALGRAPPPPDPGTPPLAAETPEGAPEDWDLTSSIAPAR